MAAMKLAEKLGKFAVAEGAARAVKWGLVGAVGMGTIEKVRGGSFFEGAGRGAMLGGVAGGITGGFSKGPLGQKISDQLSTILKHKDMSAVSDAVTKGMGK